MQINASKMKANAVLLHSCEVTSGTPGCYRRGLHRFCTEHFGEMSHFQFEQIGVIRSPYKEKFAVPRQPGLVKSASGELHLLAPYNQADAVRGWKPSAICG